MKNTANCALTTVPSVGGPAGRGIQCRKPAREVKSIDCIHCGNHIGLREPERCETPVFNCANCGKWPARSIPRGKRFNAFRGDTQWTP